MKATIVKNNNFETIGFQVEASGKTLYSWGISSSNKFNYIKEIDCNDWMTQIIELIKIDAQLEVENRFLSNFYETLQDSPGVSIKTDGGICIVKADERINKLKTTRTRIIEAIL